MTYGRAAAAGALATLVWAAAEPLDKRLLRHDYADVALLGKAATRSRAWPVVGTAAHAVNGALFGLAFAAAGRRLDVPARRLAVAMALVEHAALFPLGAVVDRRHPARGTPGLAPLFSKRAFAQATIRHLLFGVVLGQLAAASER